MLRQVIKIDEEKCVGCGLCASACHEGAIGMENGKAKLLRDDYCDGLGNCLPVCPTKAITFEEREASEYNKEVAPKRVEAKKTEGKPMGCPGTRLKTMERNTVQTNNQTIMNEVPVSQLRQWPVQIKLVPINAPYFDEANLLVAADCTAFAYANIHNEFMKNKITLIGCPKLDEGDYSEKLTAIIQNNNIKSVTVLRMEVPCCGGIEHAVKTALQNSGKFLPWRVAIISTDGNLINDSF